MIFTKVPVGLLIISSIFLLASGTPRRHRDDSSLESSPYQFGRATKNVLLPKPKTDNKQLASLQKRSVPFPKQKQPFQTPVKPILKLKQVDKKPLKPLPKQKPVDKKPLKPLPKQKQVDKKPLKPSPKKHVQKPIKYYPKGKYYAKKSKKPASKHGHKGHGSKTAPTNRKRPPTDEKLVAEMKKIWVISQLPPKSSDKRKVSPKKELQRAIKKGIQQPTRADIMEALEHHWITYELPGRFNQAKKNKKPIAPKLTNEDHLTALKKNWIKFRLPSPKSGKMGRAQSKIDKAKLEDKLMGRIRNRQPTNRDVVNLLKKQVKVNVDDYQSLPRPKVKGRGFSKKKKVYSEEDEGYNPEEGRVHGDDFDHQFGRSSLTDFVGKQFGERKIVYGKWNDTLASHGNPANRPIGSTRPRR